MDPRRHVELIFFNVWDSIGKKCCTFLHSSWERGCVNLILLPNLALDVNSSSYVACNLSYIYLEVLNVCQYMGEYRRKNWSGGCQPDIFNRLVTGGMS